MSGLAERASELPFHLGTINLHLRLRNRQSAGDTGSGNWWILAAYRKHRSVDPLRLFSERYPTGRRVFECGLYGQLSCLRRAIFGLGCFLSISIRPERHIRRTPDRRGHSPRPVVHQFESGSCPTASLRRPLGQTEPDAGCAGAPGPEEVFIRCPQAHQDHEQTTRRCPWPAGRSLNCATCR